MYGLSILKVNDPECSVQGFRHKPPKGKTPIGLLALLQRLGHHSQDPCRLDSWMLAAHDVAKVARHLHGDQHPPAAGDSGHLSLLRALRPEQETCIRILQLERLENLAESLLAFPEAGSSASAAGAPARQEMRHPGRHPIDPSVVQQAVKRALDETGVSKQASSHIFRHFECLCHAGLR
jgi:hypothetical protein